MAKSSRLTRTAAKAKEENPLEILADAFEAREKRECPFDEDALGDLIAETNRLEDTSAWTHDDWIDTILEAEADEDEADETEQVSVAVVPADMRNFVSAFDADKTLNARLNEDAETRIKRKVAPCEIMDDMIRVFGVEGMNSLPMPGTASQAVIDNSKRSFVFSSNNPEWRRVQIGKQETNRSWYDTAYAATAQGAALANKIDALKAKEADEAYTGNRTDLATDRATLTERFNNGVSILRKAVLLFHMIIDVKEYGEVDFIPARSSDGEWRKVSKPLRLHDPKNPGSATDLAINSFLRLDCRKAEKAFLARKDKSVTRYACLIGTLKRDGDNGKDTGINVTPNNAFRVICGMANHLKMGDQAYSAIVSAMHGKDREEAEIWADAIKQLADRLDPLAETATKILADMQERERQGKKTGTNGN